MKELRLGKELHCEDCIFFDNTDEEFADENGYCRKNPPIESSIYGWPVVDKHIDWCGGYALNHKLRSELEEGAIEVVKDMFKEDCDDPDCNEHKGTKH